MLIQCWRGGLQRDVIRTWVKHARTETNELDARMADGHAVRGRYSTAGGAEKPSRVRPGDAIRDLLQR